MKDKSEWLNDDEIQELIEWLEHCTLAELILAREFIESYRGKNQ